MMQMPQAPFFNAFAEPAIWKKSTGDVEIQIIANFNIDMESIFGEDYPTGYVGVFELTSDVFKQIKSGDKITFQGKLFEILRKEQFTSQNGCKVVVQA